MNRFYLLLAMGISSLGTLAQRPVDMISYRYELTVNDYNDSLKGIAHLRLNCLEDLKELAVDLRQNREGKGFVVSSVRSRQPFNFRQEQDRILIDLGDRGIKDSVIDLSISYAGIPADGLIISRNKFGKRTFFADNWPNRAHEWIPCVDDPADKAMVEFHITAPAKYQVISNGIKTGEKELPGGLKTTSWAETVDLPTKVMAVGIAEFAVQEAGKLDSIPVSSWVFPENKNEGFADYGIAPDILAWMSGYIGPYPYKKLANVQSRTIFGGMENASAIFYDENSVNGRKDKERLIAHEIAHQYFGNMVTETNFTHIWLSEGFATYLSYLYLESKYGADTLKTIMSRDRDQVIRFSSERKTPVADSVTRGIDLLNLNSYQKGSWVLHILRRQTGDTIFQKILRTFYHEFKGKNANTADFQSVAERLSGKDLNQFFKQWIHTTGQPDLVLNWEYDNEYKSVIIRTRQNQSIPFEFDLDIDLVLEDGQKIRHKLPVSLVTQELQFPCAVKPQAVLADPDVSLLGRVKVE